MQILTFEADALRLALPVENVREIVRAMAVTPVSGAPAVIEGIINLRGELLPVVDLRVRFHLPRRPIEPDDHLVVALAEERSVVLHTDRVNDLVGVDAGEIDDAPGSLSGFEYVQGIAKLPDGLVLICDLGAFLSQAEAETLAHALATSEAGA